MSEDPARQLDSDPTAPPMPPNGGVDDGAALASPTTNGETPPPAASTVPSASNDDVEAAFGIPPVDPVDEAFGFTKRDGISISDNDAAMDGLIAAQPSVSVPEEGSSDGTILGGGSYGVTRRRQSDALDGTYSIQPNASGSPTEGNDETDVMEEVAPVGYQCWPIQIKPSAVFETLIPPPEDDGDEEEPKPTSAPASEGDPAVKSAETSPAKSPAKKKKVPKELPEMMNMPLPMRCDFCIKFDSVCSNCHFKWKGLLEIKRKALQHSISGMPEANQVGIAFATAAKGTLEMLNIFLDIHPEGTKWCLDYKPLPGEKMHPQFKAGPMFLLHLACAYNRLKFADALIEKGAQVRRDGHKVVPFAYLVNPPQQCSLSDDWESMLENKPVYIHWTMLERAKTLRKEHRYDDALAEYDEIIKEFPGSEGAVCGIAKMFYDQKKYKKCIKQCDIVLATRHQVNWIEFTPQTISELRSTALAALHEECHGKDGPALKDCGCILTNRVRLHLRRLPFKLIKNNILPYCVGIDLFELYQSTKIPVLRQATEFVASRACDTTIGTLLSSQFGYEEMYESIAADKPTQNKNLGPMEKFLGVQVVAMGDFHTFILRAGARCQNPKYKKKDGWFSKKDDKQKPTVLGTKLFRVHRVDVGKAWDVQESGEWEMSDPLLDLPNA